MLKNLKNDESGFALIFIAIALPLLFLIIFLSLDVSKSQSSYLDNQAAVDAAALAVADVAVEEKIRTGRVTSGAYDEYARKAYDTNFQLDQGYANNVEFEVSIDNSSVVTVYSCVETQSIYGVPAKVDNAKKLKACNTAKAIIPDVSNIEIALGLDITPSMLAKVELGGVNMTKIEALKRALVGDGTNGGLLNSDLVKEAENSGSVYWSVIPFRGMVDLGSNWQNVVANDWENKRYPTEIYNPQSYLTSNGANDEIVQSEQKEYEVLARMRVNNDCDATSLNPRTCGIEAYKDALDNRVSWPETTSIANQRSHIYWPPNHSKALKSYYHDNAKNLLGRVPLTERANGKNSLSLDARPVGNDKFKAYWHHPRKNWFGYATYINVGIWGVNAHTCFAYRPCGGGGGHTPVIGRPTSGN